MSSPARSKHFSTCALMLALGACGPLSSTLHLGGSSTTPASGPTTSSAAGDAPHPADSGDGDLAAERAARSSQALATRNALIAKDCTTLKDGDLDALLASYKRSPTSLSVDDRVQIAIKFVACKRDVELFEKVVADVDWDTFAEKFPKDVAWLPRLEAYLASGSSRFPDHDDGDSTVSNLWVWERIAKRDGVSARLCNAAFAHRGDLGALSAGAPLAFVCANAGNAKAVGAIVPALLSSQDADARVDGCDALAILPRAATPKVARVVKEMSYADPYHVWVDDVLKHPVQERCTIAAKKIALEE